MPVLLPVCVLLSALSIVAGGTLPASFVLLPLSSFNATLVAAYSCSPTYAHSACSGHGECHLLLDATANASQPLLSHSTAQPIPAADSALDTHNIDADTPLPAAVCLCDTGYTGRGDYINHYALDGDSCGIEKHVTVALCVVGLVLFALLFLLGLYRFAGWLSWYRQHEDGDPAVVASSQLSSDEADFTKPPVSQRSRTTDGGPLSPVVRVLSPRDAASPSHATSGAVTKIIKVKSPRPLTATNKTSAGGNGAPQGWLSAYKRQSGGGGSRWAAFSHISFCHPLCSIVLATTIATFYILRLATDLTVGESLVMSALCYVSHHAYYIGSCVATYHMLRLAATITRKQTRAGGLSAVMREVKVALYCMVSFSLVVWLLLFLLPATAQAQQTTAILVLTVLHAPVWAIAVLSMIATRRITAALIQNLDKLSAQQRDARTVVCRKLRSQSNVVLALVTVNVGLCATLSGSSWLRQAGMPYFHLFTAYFVWMTHFIRLLLIQPPGAAAAVAPHSSRPLTAGNTKPPVHIPTKTTAAAASAQEQVRHLRLAGSAVSQSGPKSTRRSRPVTAGEHIELEGRADEHREPLTVRSSGAASIEVNASQKPRLSIVADME